MVSLSLLAALVLHPTFVSCGVHTVTVSGLKSVTYDAVVLTDAPGSFEPR